MMFDSNNPDAPGRPDAPRHGSRSRRRTGTMIGIPLAVVGGLVLGSQAMAASPTPAAVHTSSGRHSLSAAALPPADRTWIEGVITDQANHAQDNVNVEAWPNDPAATAPAASSLTYGGPPTNPKIQHGFFLLEVPSNQAYRIVFSAVGGKEDGDQFRMKRYSQGRPIMVRTMTQAAAPGRIRDLGTIALARQGKVKSTTKVHLGDAKITTAKRAKLHVKVTSPFVSDVTGKVVVRVAGKRVKDKVTKRDHGKTTVKLPHLKRAGKYKVKAKFVGTGTVHRSKAKPVKLTVRKKK